MTTDELRNAHAALPALDNVAIYENGTRQWNDPAWRFYQLAALNVPALLAVAEAAREWALIRAELGAALDARAYVPPDRWKDGDAAEARLRAALARLEDNRESR